MTWRAADRTVRVSWNYLSVIHPTVTLTSEYAQELSTVLGAAWLADPSISVCQLLIPPTRECAVGYKKCFAPMKASCVLRSIGLAVNLNTEDFGVMRSSAARGNCSGSVFLVDFGSEPGK